VSSATQATAETARSDAPVRTRRRTPLSAHGQPMVWLTGGALAISVAMILGLLAIVLWYGLSTFWPLAVVQLQTKDGRTYMGEVYARETYAPGPEVLEALPEALAAGARERVAAQGGTATRREIRTGNFELTGEHFVWVSDFEVARETRPEWALVLERLAWGRFYGTPAAFLIDGERVATDPAEVWALVERHRPAARARWRERRALEDGAIGSVNRRLDQARLRVRRAELDHGPVSPEHAAARRAFEEVEAATKEDFDRISAEIDALKRENERYALVMRTADGGEQTIGLVDVVRAYPANRLGLLGKVGVYLSRWWEFLSDEPREANSEGGVFPAIFGTVLMTMIMSLLVVPFGVLAALYLREYARQGFAVSLVRIAVNNLAGVPSIVFGVFGLGFFCYIVGGGLDRWLYPERLPAPTFGKGGLMWASLTLALLTLPVVIVATEEALSAVPGSMREGSYACGATKWQTIRRIVLPRAMPGIMTGMILAVARGAGEVAPLMLVGAVKLAPELPFALRPPFGIDRSFMHLGFHIYDLGFQSQNSEAAKPMVYTTTLLLIGIVVCLNVAAIRVRTRLRRRFAGGHF
jgi:phosphate transport system permease protein